MARKLFYPFLFVWFWWLFLKYRNQLPTMRKPDQPKLEFDIMAQAFYWEDEGLWEIYYRLINPFRSIIIHRTQILVGSELDVGYIFSKKLDKLIFRMAKKYFPGWIGFEPARCQYDPKLSDHLKRIYKVRDWQAEKFFEEDDKRYFGS